MVTSPPTRHRIVPEARLRHDGPGRYKTMTVHPHEFIRRFLIHVLPKGLHRIRHYGLLANGQREVNLAKARELLRVKEIDPADDDLHRANGDDTADAPAMLPRPCPCLRWPHAHHRDLRRRLPAAITVQSARRQAEGRHVMTAPIAINHHVIDHHYCWSRTGTDGACPDRCRKRRQIDPQRPSDVMIAETIGRGQRIVSPGLLNRCEPRRRSPPAALSPTTEFP